MVADYPQMTQMVADEILQGMDFKFSIVSPKLNNTVIPAQAGIQ